MTVCNMSIEWGAKAGMIAPDETTYSYLERRPHAPKGAAWEAALDCWRALATDEGAAVRRRDHDRRHAARASRDVGHQPGPGGAGHRPGAGSALRHRRESARATWASVPGTALTDIAVDRVFIGSCTNARLEDLRAAAKVIGGRHVHPKVRAMVVPGSTSVKRAAEDEGLDLIFKTAGFEWRNAGCSMCLGMNPDILAPRRAVRLDLEPELRRHGRARAAGRT